MHLLHTKSWHVKSAANIARVQRDEQDARAKQLQHEAKALAADRESRLELLRARSRSGQPPSSFLDPHPSDAVFVGDDDSDTPAQAQDTQLHKDRHDLTQFRSDDGHFNFFARPDSGNGPALFASGATKSSSRKAQDKQFSKSRHGDGPGSGKSAAVRKPTEEDAFRLGGKPLDVPWYQRTDDRDASTHNQPPPLVRTRQAHRDWHDPIFDMGFSDRKRELVDPRPSRSDKHRNRDEASAKEKETRRPRERSRSRDRWRHGDEEMLDREERSRSIRERERDGKMKEKGKSKSKRRDRSGSRSTSRGRRSTSVSGGASEFARLREERLKREAVERVRVQKLMAANQSLVPK